MRLAWLALGVAALALPALAEPGPVVRVDFSNPQLSPSKWTLVLYPNGSAHFHSERGVVVPDEPQAIQATAVDRDVQLSEPFAQRVFDAVHRHQFLHQECESHLKVAFQGWKKISYMGPDGEGSCEFNYAKDKEIQSLGDSFVAVASTIIEGTRLELLLQHDPLGLDHEMEYVMEASGDGRMQQICAIGGILQKLEEDPAVMERVRRRARALLAESK